jgi:hypothetical protein
MWIREEKNVHCWKTLPGSAVKPVIENTSLCVIVICKVQPKLWKCQINLITNPNLVYTHSKANNMIPHEQLDMTADVASADVEFLVPLCVLVSLVLLAFCGEFNTSLTSCFVMRSIYMWELPIYSYPQRSASKGQILSLRAFGHQVALQHVLHAGSPQGHIFMLTLRIIGQVTIRFRSFST